MASSGVGWATNDIKVAVLLGAYTFDKTHQFVTDLGANIVGRSANLGTKTAVAGVLKSDPAFFAALAGSRYLYAVLFIDTGSDATSSLLGYYDTGTNIPNTPNGIDEFIAPDPVTGWIPL